MAHKRPNPESKKTKTKKGKSKHVEDDLDREEIEKKKNKSKKRGKTEREIEMKELLGDSDEDEYEGSDDEYDEENDKELEAEDEDENEEADKKDEEDEEEEEKKESEDNKEMSEKVISKKKKAEKKNEEGNKSIKEKATKRESFDKTKASNQIIVRNLSYTATTEQIAEYFAKFGEIDSLKLIERNGKPSGQAVILFKSIEAVAKAISANGKEFQGRELKIKKVEDLKQASMDKTRIFIGGLSMSTNKTTIKKFFKDCGDIKGINIISGNAKDRKSVV